jgi:hypothetical protein
MRRVWLPRQLELYGADELGSIHGAEQKSVPCIEVGENGAPVVGRSVTRHRRQEANGRAGIDGIPKQFDQILQFLVRRPGCQELDLHVRR